MREDVLQKLLSIKEEKNLCISCVLAQSLNGVIGIGGDLPWSEPEDLRFFAKVTKESWLIMGRKTWNSFERSLPRGDLPKGVLPKGVLPKGVLPKGVLPGRNLIILSDKGVTPPSATKELILFVPNVTKSLENIPEKSRVCVVGGSSIYTIYFPLFDEIYVTLVKIICEGDTFFDIFSHIRAREWRLEEQRGLSRRAELFHYKRISRESR